MNSQDFEAYADLKPINKNIADTWANSLQEAISWIGEPKDKIQLLDYGCGDGKYFTHYQKVGLRVENLYGLEISKKRIERCLDAGWKNARVLYPNQPIEFPNQKFHLINCMEVIEHIPEEEGKRVIAELKRLLKPGGVLLISTPNYPIKRFYDFCDAFFHGKWDRINDDPTHVTFFNRLRLTGLLSPHFTRLESRVFKPGFLYKRLKQPKLMHKLFYLCRA